MNTETTPAMMAKAAMTFATEVLSIKLNGIV